MGGHPLTVRVNAVVRGRVQGVGFRWFVRERAQSLNVAGWVRNCPDGAVELEAQGSPEAVERFLNAVKAEHPYARVEDMESREIATKKEEGFSIH